MNDYRQKYFDLRMLIKQLRRHERNHPEHGESFHQYDKEQNVLRKLIDDFIKEGR